MSRDPEAISHQEWLGYVQPIGLVVSIPALLAAQAHVNKNILPDHQRFLSCLPKDKTDTPIPEIRDFADFVHIVFNWRKTDLQPVHAGDSQYSALEVTLPEYHETLRPTHVIREQEPKDPQHSWMMLIQIHPLDTQLDSVATADHRNWQATPQAKFERLLRETRVPLSFHITHGATMSGEAIETLCVLLADIACMIYNSVSDRAHLPSFLMHDSPREADLGLRLYRSFIRFVASLQTHFGGADTSPFQYILTTTTAPPEELRSEQVVKLHLNAAIADKLLFKESIAEPTSADRREQMFK